MNSCAPCLGKAKKGNPSMPLSTTKTFKIANVKGEVSIQVFLKAFEIYIHATQYNTEDAFGCSKCPEEGESEDDYETIRKVHISDGIDMGNMQYPTKGLIGQDLFRVPKVTTGVHCSVNS